MSTTSTPIRRPRQITTVPVAPKIPPQVEQLAVKFYALNKAANEAEAKAKATRKQLLDAMESGKITEFDIEAVLPDARLILHAEVAAQKYECIDVAKLQTIVPNDVFMRCISATKGRVEEIAGEAIVARTAFTALRERNVTVKPKK